MATVDPIEAHSIYQKVSDRVEATDRPPAPWHLGGATPMLSDAPMVRIAIWAAEQTRGFVPPEEHETFDRILARSQRSLESPRGDVASKLQSELREMSNPPDPGSEALQAARKAAAVAAWNLSDGEHPLALGNLNQRRGRRLEQGQVVALNAGIAARQAAYCLLVARHAQIAGTGRQPGPVQIPGFLLALDRRIMREECADEIAALRPKGPEVAHVLCRGRTDRFFVVRFEGGEYGLLSERPDLDAWELILGTRDDVLASVPDEHFEWATSVALVNDDLARLLDADFEMPDAKRVKELLAGYARYAKNERARWEIAERLWVAAAHRKSTVLDAAFSRDLPGFLEAGSIPRAKEVFGALLAAGKPDAVLKLAATAERRVTVGAFKSVLGAYQGKQDIAGAKTFIQGLLENTTVSDPEYVVITNNLGVMHVLLREFVEAEALYLRLFAMDWRHFEPSETDGEKQRNDTTAFQTYFRMAKFNHACVLALTERPDLAIAALREATARGHYKREQLLAESDFATLRDRDDFKSIVASLESA